jgi:sulfur-carrier protein
MSEARTINVLYFAWVRERIGRGSELLNVPTSIVTVADLVGWLKARGPEYELAFAKPDVIRAALDQTHVKSSTPLGDAREVAFFPPVTGG